MPMIYFKEITVTFDSCTGNDYYKKFDATNNWHLFTLAVFCSLLSTVHNHGPLRALRAVMYGQYHGHGWLHQTRIQTM